MRLILLALPLAACQTPFPQFPEFEIKGCERQTYQKGMLVVCQAPVSQVPEFEAKGYKRQTYQIGIKIVPCLRWENDDPLTGKAHRMTAEERMDWQQAKGGYLSDCGEYNEQDVWG